MTPCPHCAALAEALREIASDNPLAWRVDHVETAKRVLAAHDAGRIMDKHAGTMQKLADHDASRAAPEVLGATVVHQMGTIRGWETLKVEHFGTHAHDASRAAPADCDCDLEDGHVSDCPARGGEP